MLLFPSFLPCSPFPPLFLSATQKIDVRYLIAEGSFAYVYKVRRRGERHALKHILLGSQYEEEDDSEVESLRQQTVMEVEILKQLKGHPNVVRLKGMIFKPS